MRLKQISVFLENRPGMLLQLTGALAAADVNMRALSLAETKDFGIARIIADDVEGAMNAIREAGFVASLTPVLAYAIPDEAGGLNKLLRIFGDAGVNIEYMYSCLFPGDDSKAVMIFRVANTQSSEEALKSLGLE